MRFILRGSRSGYRAPVAAACLVALSAGRMAQGAETPGPAPWHLDEVRRELALNPTDTYLQYVALQLAQREGKTDVENEIARNVGQRLTAQFQAADRREQVDVFSMFTGALAVQESLQLDTLRGTTRDGDRTKRVDVSSLKAPDVKSHPWEKMLGNSKPEVSALSHQVPADYYLVEFTSLNKLLDTLDTKDLWGTHLLSQASNEARSPQVSERLKRQLAIETNPLLRPFYDMIVEEVAVTGSDLYVNEGSDVTLLFQIKQPDVFKARMDGFLENAAKAHPEAKRETGTFMDVPYVQLSTPDREVHVISAYPAPNLHIRSNSLVAFQHIIEAMKGKPGAATLANSQEFQFIRTLMPRGAKEEDGLVYLSDPFIRRLVGPEVKLTELERLTCYNHMRMLSHATLMYRTETGQMPESIEKLVEAKCLPKGFKNREIACPAGGTYTLTADGLGACTVHGRAHCLTPCCEVPVKTVSQQEAEDYGFFVTGYEQYWRMYFDPIAIRIKVEPKQLRAETIVLPLIDNSIYTNLSRVLGGATEQLDGLPVPARNIFSVGFKLNKAEVLRTAEQNGVPLNMFLLNYADQKALNAAEFFSNGIGNQIAFHVYDAAPTFDVNVAQLLGQVSGTFNGTSRSEGLAVAFALASLNTPVYLSAPVQNANVVDDFLAKLDALLVADSHKPETGGWWSVKEDAYTSELPGNYTLHAHTIGFESVKWRICWARIGNGLYIASKPTVLTDIAALEGNAPANGNADTGPAGHAMVRVRPQNWKESLPDFRLGWEENNRRACLNNLAPLSNVARAFKAAEINGDRAAHAVDFAPQFYGTRFFCPDGGAYELAPDGRHVVCSKHGSVAKPRQPLAPDDTGPAGKAISTFAGMTATLTFMEDGLHAVLTIDRK